MTIKKHIKHQTCQVKLLPGFNSISFYIPDIKNQKIEFSALLFK